MRACWLLLFGIALTRSADADACSCPYESPTLAPSDQATDVPRNALLVARASLFVEPSFELRVADTNELVPVTIEQRPMPDGNGQVRFARPATLLAAHTRYVFTFQPFAASDETKTTATFTTGDTLDTTPPAFAGITALSLETMNYPITACTSDCVLVVDDHISRIRIDFVDPPPDAVYLGFELSRPGQSAFVERAIAPSDARRLGFEPCSAASPSLDIDGEYCARVVAYDIAGNRSGQDVEVCGTTQRCLPTGPALSNGEICEPSDECLPDDGRLPGLQVAPSEGGCSTSSPSGLVVLALLGLLRRRTFRKTARR